MAFVVHLAIRNSLVSTSPYGLRYKSNIGCRVEFSDSKFIDSFFRQSL